MAKSTIVLGIGAGDSMFSFLTTGLNSLILSGIAFDFSNTRAVFEDDKSTVFESSKTTQFEDEKTVELQ